MRLYFFPVSICSLDQMDKVVALLGQCDPKKVAKKILGGTLKLV